jgi:hypothetical protein
VVRAAARSIACQAALGPEELRSKLSIETFEAVDSSENATEFLDRMVREEKLVAGRIEPLVPERVRRAKAATE